MKCSICLAEIADHRKECSAQPINDGRCCIACDDLIVTPVRIVRATGQAISEAIALGLITHLHLQQLRKQFETK